MTRDEIAALRELAEKGTKVVSWYPYGDTDGTVRGPFFRWFKCSEVDPQYKNNVASITDECNWVAAALNNFARLLDEVESTQAKLSAAEKERDDLRGKLAHTIELRNIPGFDNYKIDEHGNVWSFNPANKRPIIMKPRDAGRGYDRITLYNGPKRADEFIHTLLLKSFIGPRPTPQHQARHLDGDKKNNQISNLQWGTASENWDDQRKHGTATVGERHNMAKLNWKKVREIRRKYGLGHSAAELAKEFGVVDEQIRNIVNFRNWKNDPEALKAINKDS